MVTVLPQANPLFHMAERLLAHLDERIITHRVVNFLVLAPHLRPVATRTICRVEQDTDMGVLESDSLSTRTQTYKKTKTWK